MKQKTLCLKCGAPVSGEVAGGFCTACLLEEGLAPAELAQNHIPLRYFGDYELIEEIARGGMGVVFKARQLSLHRIVAVKMILSGHLASEAQAQRFRAEARAAAALQHPGIVAIHEVGEHEGLLFFSMDYVVGQNLAQLVHDEPLPSRKAAIYLKTIAEAVHYAHSRGVLHRDLKPSNILVDENDQPRITDFGLAKQLNSDNQLSTNDPQLTLSGQILGSPSFIPPEQAAGQKSAIGPASDVYSLGAILYHCLTGRPPFVAETLTQTLRMVAENEVVSPRLLNGSVPLDLATVCLKCLEKEPQRRYDSARQVSEELDRFLKDEPILAQSHFSTDFDKTLWVNSEYMHGYLEHADAIIPERRYLFDIICSFLHQFARGESLRICDLGCGDGALAQQILSLLPNVSLTLIDGSAAMLNAAQRRLGDSPRLRFVHSKFEALIDGRLELGPFDFIVSSFALHHLTQGERVALFFRLQEQLDPGGWFLNGDTVLPDEVVFTDWQYKLWRERILQVEQHRAPVESLRDAPDEARRNPDNKLSRLSSQLNALRRAGFEHVDCLYRNGIFVVYCGCAPGDGPFELTQRSLKEAASLTTSPGKTVRFGLIGDYHPEVTAHRAIARALELVNVELAGWRVHLQWLPTDAILQMNPDRLFSFDGLWCVPASPYVSTDGALRAIEFAREQGIPFLGTCAGFQHALLDYARHVLGMADADHEESNPNAACLLVSRLACPLVEQERRILIEEGSRLRHIYGCSSAAEVYHCNFGLNQTYEGALDHGQLRVSARDAHGSVQAVELAGHPFFLATLFQPERSALRSEIHPVISAFAQAALVHAQISLTRG